MRLILFLGITLILTSCNFTKSNKIKTELETLFNKEFAKDEPGGSILVKKGDEIVFLKSYGLADLETKEKITANTVFNIGSISKTFVSNGILILKERELISLEDSISKYFNDFENPTVISKIKIKHLLTHTSGLPDIRKVSDNFDFYLTAKDKENFEPLKKVDSLNFQAGEKFEYSNPSFNGLALIIENLSHQPWQRFIEDNIFKPSEMTNSKITDGSYPQNGVAHAYDVRDSQYIEYDYGEFPTFAAAGNGGIWSTVLDLAKYEKAIQNNTFLNTKSIKESRTIFRSENWEDTLNPFIGYSWFIGEEKMFENPYPVDFVYHTGSQGGFRAFYIIIPEKNILFIGLFNRPLTDVRKLIHETLNIFERNNWFDHY